MGGLSGWQDTGVRVREGEVTEDVTVCHSWDREPRRRSRWTGQRGMYQPGFSQETKQVRCVCTGACVCTYIHTYTHIHTHTHTHMIYFKVLTYIIAGAGKSVFCRQAGRLETLVRADAAV